jgi:hypothetical protein
MAPAAPRGAIHAAGGGVPILCKCAATAVAFFFIETL